MVKYTPKERYEMLVNIIDYNGGRKKPYVVKRVSVRTIACSYGPTEPEDFEKTLRRAKERSEIVVGSEYLTTYQSEDRLKTAMNYVVDNADNPRQFVAQANQILA